MAVSSRVREDPTGERVEGVAVGTTKSLPYIIQPTKKGKYRVYEVHDDYSTTSGGFSIRGKVEKAPSGTIIQFDTQSQAEDWVKAGLPVVDPQGEELW